MHEQIPLPDWQSEQMKGAADPGATSPLPLNRQAHRTTRNSGKEGDLTSAGIPFQFKMNILRGRRLPVRFDGYDTEGFYDEMFAAGGRPRAGAKLVAEKIDSLPGKELRRRQQAAERALLHLGITYSLHGDAAGSERIFPFDIIPRIIPQDEWEVLERGLRQRVRALNLFLQAIYNAQKILKDRVLPEELVLYEKDFFPMVEHSYLKEELPQISDWWMERLRHSILDLPSEWIERVQAQLATPDQARKCLLKKGQSP